MPGPALRVRNYMFHSFPFHDPAAQTGVRSVPSHGVIEGVRGQDLMETAGLTWPELQSTMHDAAAPIFKVPRR